MGYTTEFEGQVTVDPPLSAEEVAYINKFSETRRMNCKQGPYYVDRSGYAGQDSGPDVIDYNDPPNGQPSLWCQWITTDNGSALEWNGAEKFYASEEWMQYLIDHFLAPDAKAKKQLPFLQANHVLNGTIYAQGEERGDTWALVVENNVVTRKNGKIVYD